MSDSKPLPPPIFSFPTSLFSPSPPGKSNDEFTFSMGPSNQSNERCSKPVKVDWLPKVKLVRHKRRSLSPTTSPYPSATFEEKETENANSKEEAHNDSIPESSTKTSFIKLSAVTGVIPCYFEGSSYSSKLVAPTCCAAGAEESIMKGTHEKSEPNSHSSEIVVVSKILKGIPHSPHFWPLKGYSEVAKQSLINAWDHIFEETVDQVLSIQVKGFSVDAKRLWETMEELQKMGYNVIALRRRLVELTDVLRMRSRHRSEIVRLKSKAEQHRMEKNRLEFEIVKLRAKAEAEKANVEDVMAQVAKMEEEMPSFNAVFTELATKLL